MQSWSTISKMDIWMLWKVGVQNVTNDAIRDVQVSEMLADNETSFIGRLFHRTTETEESMIKSSVPYFEVRRIRTNDRHY